jgi:hypothetical protein
MQLSLTCQSNFFLATRDGPYIQINDGTFTHTKVVGQGITARLLQAYGIKVFSEHQLEEAQVYLQNTL